MNPESLIEAGQGLIALGRHIQKTWPKPNTIGSQFGECEIIEKLLPGDSGLYIEIGANDGIENSNTYRFYKKGWRGLLVEPLIDAIPSLLLNRPGDLICPLAASDQDGYATLNVCRSVSSLDQCWRKDNESRMPVRTEKLSTILARYPATDWSKTRLLSVDCEGHELQVLRGIDWSTFNPEVVIIEFCNQQGVDISAPWKPILDANYTEFFRNSLNLILVRKQ